MEDRYRLTDKLEFQYTYTKTHCAIIKVGCFCLFWEVGEGIVQKNCEVMSKEHIEHFTNVFDLNFGYSLCTEVRKVEIFQV